MNVFKKMWEALSYQEKQPTGLTQTQLLERLVAILSSLDDKQQEIVSRITHFEQHMNTIHERQITTLNKMDFMLRTEEKQITHISRQMDDQGGAWIQEQSHDINP